jgi:hypothetical protein
MTPMRTFARYLSIFAMLLLCESKVAFAQEAVAQKAAEDILRSFDNGQFKTVWDQKVSQYVKERTSEDVFLSSMSIGRPALGKLIDLTSVGRDHFSRDPTTGYEGDIYGITFRSKYTSGEFYERVVVVKDADGIYKLANISGSPVPKK